MVKLAADLRDDVAQKVECPRLVRSEGLPVIVSKADTPGEIVRAGSGEERVACVQ